MFQKSPGPLLGSLAREFPRLTLLAATMLALLTPAGDILLPVIGHVLHLLIELIELPLEHLLELAFHLTPRQSQGVLAWTALFVLIIVAVRFVRATLDEGREAVARSNAALQRLKGRVGPLVLNRPATTLTLTVGLLGALALVMF